MPLYAKKMVNPFFTQFLDVIKMVEPFFFVLFTASLISGLRAIHGITYLVDHP